MVHPIADLQAAIITALSTDSALITAIGANAIFDMPPKAKSAPYIVILRHDLVVRDTDLAPGNDHRLQFQIWHTDPARAAVLVVADRVIQVLADADLSTPTLVVTHVQHQRTETMIDRKSGLARALLAYRIFSEPAL